MKIILLGSIPKGDEIRKKWTDWKTDYIEKISKSIPDANFLHGDLISDKEGPEVVVGHDLYLVKHSDIAIVHAVEKSVQELHKKYSWQRSFKSQSLPLFQKTHTIENQTSYFMEQQ